MLFLVDRELDRHLHQAAQFTFGTRAVQVHACVLACLCLFVADANKRGDRRGRTKKGEKNKLVEKGIGHSLLAVVVVIVLAVVRTKKKLFFEFQWLQLNEKILVGSQWLPSIATRRTVKQQQQQQKKWIQESASSSFKRGKYIVTRVIDYQPLSSNAI